MRAVWASAILFVLMIALIVWNGWYVRQSADEMLSLAARLESPEDRQEALAALESFWASRKGVLELSMKYADIDRLAEAIDRLRWADSLGLTAEFEKYRLRLISSVEGFARVERLCPENLF